MEAQEFRVVYDILRESAFALTWFPIFWLLGACLFTVVFFFNLKARKFKFEEIQDYLGLLILPIFLVVGVFATTSTYRTQQGCLDSAKNGLTQIVQGRIENLKTESKRESFSVNGKSFEYREYDLTVCGYTQSKGIKLQNGNLVKITYSDDRIFKFEIADQ